MPEPDIDPPPFLGSWPRVFYALLVWLALVITSLWLFTERYSR